MAEPLTIEAHGVSYEIENPGGLVGKSLCAGNPYEARVLEHIYRRGFEGIAVDAGASVGNHSLWFAVVCGLEVVAFEPIFFDALERNLALNDLPIVAHRTALGAEEGKARPLGKGRLRVGAGDVAVCPLDGFALDAVAVLKIDVEGMEPEVLLGGLETIRRCRPVIYAETWDGDAHDGVAAILQPLGYGHVKTFGATPLEEWEPC